MESSWNFPCRMFRFDSDLIVIFLFSHGPRPRRVRPFKVVETTEHNRGWPCSLRRIDQEWDGDKKYSSKYAAFGKRLIAITKMLTRTVLLSAVRIISSWSWWASYGRRN
jgi:hypothetical protein